jgi:hypothetical protein
MTERKAVVPIRFPPSWIKWIQEWCEFHGITKSEYIQAAVKERMLEDGYVPEK